MTDILESPDLQQLGKQALQDLLNNLTQAKAFAVDQAPEFCQQIIARGMWMPLSIGCVLLFISLILGAAAIAGLIGGKRMGWRDGFWVFPALFGSAPFCLAFPISLHHLYRALNVYVAPKVFLVEELMRMVK